MRLVTLLLMAINALASTPEQIHTAVGSTPGTMFFTWSTRDYTPTSAVKIGLNPSYWKYNYGSSINFTNATNSWVIHTVNVTLYPGTTYIYQVGCIATVFSDSITLYVPGTSGPSSYIMIADLDTALDGEDSWAEIEDLVTTSRISAIVHAGDVAYDLATNHATWGDTYMNSIQKVASSIPYMVVAGNHEADDNYVNYNARFRMPNNGYYYTWTSGLVRFLGIDTEIFINRSPEIGNMMGYIQTVLNRTSADKQQYP